MQDCSNSSALARGLLQSCTKPSIWCYSGNEGNILFMCSLQVEVRTWTGNHIHLKSGIVLLIHPLISYCLSERCPRSLIAILLSMIFKLIFGLSSVSKALSHQNRLTSISAWIYNHISSKHWDEITYPFPNLIGCIVEACDGICNFIPYFIMCITTYPCRY